MRKLAYVLLALVVVIIGAALLAPLLIPTDVIKTRVGREVQKATGRTLAIDGPVSVSVLPTIAVEAEQVRLANAEGGSEADMVRLGTLEVELKLLPLLSGSVEIARFVLVKPEIHLEVMEDGRANWQFTPEGDGTATAPAPSEEDGRPEQAPEEGVGGLPVSDLKLGEVRLVDGTLTYANQQTGQNERVEAIDVSLELEDAKSPFAADGSLRYKGRDVVIDLDVARPLALLQQGASPLQAAVASEGVVQLQFDGEVSNAEGPSGGGSLDLAVESIRDLAAWLAEPLDFPGEGLRTLEISGRIEGDPERVAFEEASIELDQVNANGSLEAVLGGSVPVLVGRLDVGTLDLNPYLPEPEQAPPSANEGAPAPEAGSGSKKPGGATSPAGWSKEPLAVPPIGGLDLRFALTVESVRARELKLGRTAVNLEIDGNTLVADLTEFQLYGGRGEGSLRFTAGNAGLELQKRFVLEGLQARPFLTDAMAFDLIEGTARAELLFETSGRSEFGLVSNLDGEGEVRFEDGAVVGYNLAQMVRQVATAGLARDERKKTDFAELGGTFTVENGVLTNDDLRLIAPLLRLNGAGRVNIKGRRINYRIEPTAAPTLEGQGGAEAVEGILVPVDIKGSWDDPKIVPDVETALESLVQNQEQLGKAAKQIEQQLKDPKAAQQLLKGLFGD